MSKQEKSEKLSLPFTVSKASSISGKKSARKQKRKVTAKPGQLQKRPKFQPSYNYPNDVQLSEGRSTTTNLDKLDPSSTIEEIIHAALRDNEKPMQMFLEVEGIISSPGPCPNYLDLGRVILREHIFDTISVKGTMLDMDCTNAYLNLVVGAYYNFGV